MAIYVTLEGKIPRTPIRCIMLIVEKLYQSLIQLELSLTRKKPTKQYLIPNITGKTP